MDAIYDPGGTFASELVNPAEYFGEFRKLVADSNVDVTDKEATEKEIFRLMRVDLDNTTATKLTETCSEDKLTVDNEIELTAIKELLANRKNYSPPPITDEAKKLCIIDSLITRTRALECMKRADKYTCSLKYRSEIMIDEYKSSGTPDLTSVNREIIFIVRVYAPFRFIAGNRLDRKPRFNFALALLGSNTLADLRDKIVCPIDMGINKDISDNPDIGEPFSGVMAKDIYKSGLIYVNGVLYEDLRFSPSTNYSDTIIKWSENIPQIGPFEVKNMADVKLNDLTIRLGYPYVYQHQGECEHLFTFSDVRLWNEYDSPYSNDYPLYKVRSSRTSKKCMMCGHAIARVLIKNCDRLPNDPALLCDVCFKSYLYIDGKKIGDFKAFLFYDENSIF